MNTSLIVILASMGSLLVLYAVFFLLLRQRVQQSQQKVLDIFLEKIAKIPAVIEVMRSYVVDEHLAFDRIVDIHAQSIRQEYGSVPMILENNARINDQYAFLMRLSMAIPELQKDTYFIYIRDFVMNYDRTMKSHIAEYNSIVKRWNRFVFIKNITLIGYLLPGRDVVEC